MVAGARILVVGADQVHAKVLLEMGAVEVVCCNSTHQASERTQGISHWKLEEFQRKSIEDARFDTVLLWQGGFDPTDNQFFESIKGCIKDSTHLAVKLDPNHSAEKDTIHEELNKIFFGSRQNESALRYQDLRFAVQSQPLDSNPHESSTGRVSQSTQIEQQNASFIERVSQSTQTEEQDVQQPQR